MLAGDYKKLKSTQVTKNRNKGRRERRFFVIGAKEGQKEKQ